MRARRLAPALHAALALAGMGCEGTSTPPPDPAPSIDAGDGQAAPRGRIQAIVRHLDASPSDFSLLTFPEWEEVEHSIDVEPSSDGASRFTFVTTVPTEARWYAVVWDPRDHPGLPEVRGGVPLADGRRAWRVFGRAHPEARRVLAVEDLVLVEFSDLVELTPGVDIGESLRLSQPGRACPPRLSGERTGLDANFACAPPLDWTSPFVLRLENLRSADGTEVPAFEEELVTAPGELEEIVFPSSLVPPPFPDSLCAAECP